MALMGLFDDEILKLLTTKDKPPTLRIQRNFRRLLEEYRSKVKHKRQRRLNSSAVCDFSEIYTIAPTSDSLKFFRNESIASLLTNYFLEKYKVTCQIPIQNQWEDDKPLNINLSGSSENIRKVQQELQVFFSKIQTKIFNDETAHKRGKR